MGKTIAEVEATGSKMSKKRSHKQKSPKKNFSSPEAEDSKQTINIKQDDPDEEIGEQIIKKDECDEEEVVKFKEEVFELVMKDELLDVEECADEVETISNSTSTSKTTSPSKSVKKKSPTLFQTIKTPDKTNTPKGQRGKKRRESESSSGEDKWLDAIESGVRPVDDVEELLKKIKDPKLMTARQRAMYERSSDKELSPGGDFLLSLPTGYRQKPQTAEEIQKKVLKNERRRQLADERREKDKQKTMDRLLKKKETKQRMTPRGKPIKVVQPMISYRNTLDGAFIQMPPELEYPLKAQTARDPPKVQYCGIAGCGNPKVYNCSKTNLPLCSFACYRKNVESLRQIIC